MRRYIAVVLCCVSISPIAAELTVPESAADEPSTPIGQTQVAADAAYRKQQVCKNEPVLGSRISQRVCRTRAQADAEQASAKAMVEGIQQSASGQSTSAN